MKLHRLLLILIAPVCLLPGCIPHVQQQVYYSSPLNGQQGEYHPLPLHADSAHTAVYAHAGFATGKANQQKTDHFNGFHGSITAAHNAGNFQFYYGLGLDLGAYTLGRWDTGAVFLGPIADPPRYYGALNQMAGDKFYGSVNFSGGGNWVIPWDHGECRLIGVETNLHHEFGDYLSYRKHVPDSLTSLNIRNSFFATVGLTTEFIGRMHDGEFGFRFAVGRALGPYFNTGVYDYESNHYLHYQYVTTSLHFTFSQYTFYVQGDWATQARSFQTGLIVRFGKPRLAPEPPKRTPVRTRPDPKPKSML